MRKLIGSVIAITGLVVGLQSCDANEDQGPKKEKLTIKVDGLKPANDSSEAMVQIVYRDTANKYVVDTLKMESGKYVFEKDINQGDDYLKASLSFTNPSLNKVHSNGRAAMNQASKIDVYFQEGTNVKLDVKIDEAKGVVDYTVDSNTKLNKDFLDYYNLMNPLLADYDAKYFSLVELWYGAEDKIAVRETPEFKQLGADLDTINSQMTKLKSDFVKTHNDSEASCVILEGMKYDMELPEYEVTFNAFSEGVKNSQYGKKLAEYITNKKKTEPGQVAQEFAAKTIDGNDFKLSDLKGKKYAIIDFWGTWCGPCVGGMPEMAKYYHKYQDKLEIIGISSDRDEAKWRKFLKEDHTDYDWTHILDSKSDIISNYSVDAFPTKIVVDKEGVIVYKIVGELPEFYTKLDEILAE